MTPVAIPLTQGKIALIDEEDVPLVAEHKWHLGRQPMTFYAKTNVPRPGVGGGRQTVLFMHRKITGFAMTDHICHHGWNNRRANLRQATRSQNMWNRVPYLTTKSTFKGVDWHKYQKKWRARAGRPSLNLGYFQSEVDAAHAYDEAARALGGPYAYVNFPTAEELARRSCDCERWVATLSF